MFNFPALLFVSCLYPASCISKIDKRPTFLFFFQLWNLFVGFDMSKPVVIRAINFEPSLSFYSLLSQLFSDVGGALFAVTQNNHKPIKG